MPNLVFDSKSYSKDNQQHSELQGVAVTPNDSADLPNGVCDAIFATTAGVGNINAVSASGSIGNVGYPLAVGINYVRASRILATSTTATGIYALYRASNL